MIQGGKIDIHGEKPRSGRLSRRKKEKIRKERRERDTYTHTQIYIKRKNNSSPIKKKEERHSNLKHEEVSFYTVT